MVEGSVSRPILRPPAGVRDLLPLDVLQKQWVEEQLNQVYESWGYQRIITPTLERLDTLTAGGSVQPESVLQVRDREGVLLGLRPEHTASIVRAACTRMAAAALPLRLYYQDTVFHGQRERERFQSGVELIGVAGWRADAEVLLLLAAALRRLQVQDWILVVGDQGLTQLLLQGFSPAHRERIRRAIADLDFVALEDPTLPEADRALGQTLINLRGDPDAVLARLQTLGIPQRERVSHLQAVVTTLQKQGIPVVLDLSLLQTYGYYSGLVFQAVAQREVIASGGRYDQLFSLYGADRDPRLPQSGIGFMLPLETLQRILSHHLPTRADTSPILVIPTDDAAFGAALTWAEAERGRDPQACLELELSGRSADEIAALASRRRIGTCVWVQADGSTHQTYPEHN